MINDFAKNVLFLTFFKQIYDCVYNYTDIIDFERVGKIGWREGGTGCKMGRKW